MREITPAPEDARLALCAAPMLEGFGAYTLRSNAALADLLIGSDALTPVQVAALNCLDDSAHFPEQAALWLPLDALAVAAVTVEPRDPATPRASAARPITLTLSPERDVLNREGTRLSWDSAVGSVRLSVCREDASTSACFELQNGTAAGIFPQTGSIVIDRFWRPGDYAVTAAPADPTVDGTPVRLGFNVTCSHVALPTAAAGLCPEAAAESIAGAVQTFERGLMLWQADTLQILVLTDDGRVRVFNDTFVEGMPDPTAEAPEGLLTPIRGFGRVWDALGGAEGSGLGFATGPETGTTVLRQPIGRTSFSTAFLLSDTGSGEFAFTMSQVPGQSIGAWFSASDTN